MEISVIAMDENINADDYKKHGNTCRSWLEIIITGMSVIATDREINVGHRLQGHKFGVNVCVSVSK